MSNQTDETLKVYMIGLLGLPLFLLTMEDDILYVIRTYQYYVMYTLSLYFNPVIYLNGRVRL